MCSVYHGVYLKVYISIYILFLSNAWRSIQVLGSFKMESISQDWLEAFVFPIVLTNAEDLELAVYPRVTWSIMLIFYCKTGHSANADDSLIWD